MRNHPVGLPRSEGAPAPARHVLVVDDSRAQRRLVSMHLARWGYRVAEAGSGEEALELCRTQAFDIVLSDWVMEGLSGVDFCHAFRALPREGYGYFIMLTSKSETSEVARGLEAGADDFLTKPVSPDELRARLRAGERILGMQAELVEKNRLIRATLDELQKLYDSLDRDLVEARKLQQTLFRERQRDFGRGTVALITRPSGHVGGDLVGCFPINARRIALYSIDVAGHGVAAAMMTARLAGLMSGNAPDHNLALLVDSAGLRDAWPPEMVAYRFNRLMLEELQVEQYFTMAYAEIDLVSGRVLLVQAGHPHPVLLRADGRAETLGMGGLPIGLIPGATWDRIEVTLRPGDRLVLMSDGLTECPDPDGQELGQEGFVDLLQRNAGLASPALLESVVWELERFSGRVEFPDDVSALAFDYRG
jgi:sigma-B regulation protein RsbU (phosphoserine phosphatase)